MTGEQKNTLIRIVITAIGLAVGIALEHSGVSQMILLCLFAAIYILIGYRVVAEAFEGVVKGEVFDENFLMLIATVAAFCLGEYAEGVAVMLFYQVGELFEGYAADKSRKSIADMMDIVPEYASIERNGALIRLSPEEIEIGTEITVKAGERIPLDGVVVSGGSLIDTSALTGESVPQRVCAGDEVFSGCVNGAGTLKVRTTKVFEDSTVKRILELVENAAGKKASTEKFITRFARYYTPSVTLCAVILALVPPLFVGGWGEWIRRACVFLVVSCPCALVISVPLAFFGGIGAAARSGILVKGGNYLEALSRMRTIAFDKTGTLTKGEFRVSEVIAKSCTREELIETAALCEGYSNHPIAASIREIYGKELDMGRVADAEEAAGYGVRAKVDGKAVLLGNGMLMSDNGIDYAKAESTGTAVYVAVENEFLGTIVISDAVKDGAKEAIEEIKAQGIRRFVMLSGDRRESAEAVARELGIDEVHAQLLPEGKVALVEEMLGQETGGGLAFVGDGINDAPVISRADIGIAMGSMGSDAAIEAADVVIMDDEIQKIAASIKIARRTVRTVRENIAFSLGVKGAVLILGALGFANMWLAVVADVGVSVIAILNSIRGQKLS